MDETNKYISLEKKAELENTSQERLKELATLNNDLAQIVASNVAAPPKLLEELAKHESKAVKKAVISNPNTPTETLLELCEQFPQEFLDNPILDFLVLEDLKFLENIPLHTLYTLIQQPKIPRFLLDYVANHQHTDIRETANMQVVVSGEMIEGWHKTVEKKILRYSMHGGYGLDFERIESEGKMFLDCKDKNDFELLTNFSRFLKFDFFKSGIFKYLIAKNYNVDPILLKQLAYDENKSIRCLVAKNSNTPAEILELLINDPDLSVRSATAENPNTPVEVLELLINDPDLSVRNCLVKNPNTPIEILKSFASDRDIRIRCNLARNPNTPAEILESLLGDDYNWSIFRGVAENSNISAEIIKSLLDDSKEKISEYMTNKYNGLWKWAKSFGESEKSRKISREYREIVYSIAKNPGTPIEVLQLLADDADSSIRSRIAMNPNVPIEILKSFIAIGATEAYYSIAKNPNTPIEILKTLASSSDADIRTSVATNPNAPMSLLEFLANDSDNHVRLAIVRNSNTPAKALKKLANDSDNLVLEYILENPQCTLEIKEIIFKSFAKSEIPSFSRFALFLSDYAESSVLAENSNSISWLERYAIARNQKTPEETLKQLAQDGNRIIRATAQENLGKR